MFFLKPKQRTKLLFDLTQTLVDHLIVNLAFFGSFLIRYGEINFDKIFAETPFLLFFAYANGIWFFITHFYDAYHNKRTETIYRVVRLNVKIVALHFFFTTAFLAFHQVEYYPTKQLFITYGMLTAAILIWRVAGISVLRYLRMKGYFSERYIIIGNLQDVKRIRSHFNRRREFGFSYAGNMMLDSVQSPEDILEFVKKTRARRVYYCASDLPKTVFQTLSQLSVNHHIQVAMVPLNKESYNTSLNVSYVDRMPLLHLSYSPLEELHNRQLKRFFDVLFSVFAFVFIFTWLFPIIAICIKLTSRGPVFFLQPREGERGRTFMCYKFRTMRVEQNISFKQATKNDPRVTSIGRFLRKTSLDEIPQFINVIKGEMSIVGPRPHPIPLNESYKGKIEDFGYRHAVKPGITGLAQAKGYRGETQRSGEMENRVKFDNFYVSRWSFFLEMKIFVLTLIQMIRGSHKAY